MPADLNSASLAVTVLLAVGSLSYATLIIWYARGLQSAKRTVEAAPTVTIVVAARDEEEAIAACLDDVLAQDYPQDLLEIIIVDDGSVDATAEFVSDRASLDRRLTLMTVDRDEPTAAVGRGPQLVAKKRALTLGIEAASGEIILTTDADCRVPATWVTGMVAYFEADVGLVAGFSAIAGSHQLRHGLEGLDFLMLMGCAAGAMGNGRPMGASSQNLGYRKAAFDEVGGYDKVADRVSGDDVLLVQLIRRLTSWRMVFASDPETFVSHPATRSWKQLLKQRQRWASNAPYQRRMDPIFFGYLTATLLLNSLLVAAPFLLWFEVVAPTVVFAGVLIKVSAELLLSVRAMRRFGRWHLLWYYPLWTVLQPGYTLLIGIMGLYGTVSWKGVVHDRGGISRFHQQSVTDTPGGDG